MKTDAMSHSAPLVALRAENTRLWQRRGLPGLWLRFTAPPRLPREMTLAETERIRKGELTSLSILIVLSFLLALVSNSLTNPATGEGVLSVAFGLAVAAIFNRCGWTRTAAYLVPLIIMATLMLVALQEGGIREITFPLYDLFVMPIVLSGFIADRRAPWILALIAIGFTLYHYTYAPRLLITGSGAVQFDEVQYDQLTYGWWGMINREVVLLFFSAFVSWVGALSVEKAITQADRSTEFAALREHEAQKEKEHSAAIASFVEELMGALAAQANGHQRYLANRPPEDQFHRYVHFINKHLQRNSQLLEQLRQQQNLWSHDQLARAVDALTKHLSSIHQGYLPLRALAADKLPPEAKGLEPLVTCFYALLIQAMSQARGSGAYQAEKGLPNVRSGPL